jgi:hypothetical protein
MKTRNPREFVRFGARRHQCDVAARRSRSFTSERRSAPSGMIAVIERSERGAKK